MIIHRALIREALQTCGAVSVILLSIFVMTRLTGFLAQAARGDVPLHDVWLLLLLKLIAYLDVIIPLVLYLSTLLVTARWAHDHELTALHACGIGIGRLIKPAMALAAIVGGMVVWIAMYLAPLSVEAGRVVALEARQRAEGGAVIPGEFTETRGGGVYFVERYDAARADFGGLFVYRRGADGEEVVTAGAGVRTRDAAARDYLTLKDGTRYHSGATPGEYDVLTFDTYALRLRPPAPSDGRLPPKGRTLGALFADGSAAARSELHWRAAKVVMLPVLMIFALGFSAMAYRTRRVFMLAAALLVYFIYANALGFAAAQAQRGALEPGGMWGVHLVFLCAAAYLLWRRHHGRLPEGL